MKFLRISNIQSINVNTIKYILHPEKLSSEFVVTIKYDEKKPHINIKFIDNSQDFSKLKEALYYYFGIADFGTDGLEFKTVKEKVEKKSLLGITASNEKDEVKIEHYMIYDLNKMHSSMEFFNEQV